MGASISGGCADEKPRSKRRKIPPGVGMLVTGCILLIMVLAVAVYELLIGPTGMIGVAFGVGGIFGCGLIFFGLVITDVNKSRML
jgi:hypothetical protein